MHAKGLIQPNLALHQETPNIALPTRHGSSRPTPSDRNGPNFVLSCLGRTLCEVMSCIHKQLPATDMENERNWTVALPDGRSYYAKLWEFCCTSHSFIETVSLAGKFAFSSIIPGVLESYPSAGAQHHK